MAKTGAGTVPFKSRFPQGLWTKRRAIETPFRQRVWEIIDIEGHGPNWEPVPKELLTWKEWVKLQPELKVMDYTESHRLKEMDACGIGFSTLLATGSCTIGGDKGHMPVIQSLVRKYPDRFIGWARWPTVPCPPVEEITKCLDYWLRQPEFRGVGEVTIGSFRRQGDRLLSLDEILDKLRVIFDTVRKFKGVVFTFHTGLSGTPEFHGYREGYRWYDPAPIGDIAAEYPDVPIIVSHMGGPLASHREAAQTLVRLYPNVYTEISKAHLIPEDQHFSLTDWVNDVGAEKILFASDSDGISKKKSPEYIIRMVEEAEISDEEREMIFGKNAMRLLKLPLPKVSELNRWNVIYP